MLTRFGDARITHISGTPTHWRKVLMSGEGHRIDPEYVRLSGEIADEAILSALHAFFPRARIEHAYASTEAGVVFAVDDGKPGFPTRWIGDRRRRSDEDCRRHVACPFKPLRSTFARQKGAPSLADEEGFVDTGDIVERRGERCLFMGRRGGVIIVGGIKIHPEEVEATLNSIDLIRASRVFARKNPVTGALVYADVVLRNGCAADANTELEILAACRARLGPHSAPAALRFVADLPMTSGGKIARHG